MNWRRPDNMPRIGAQPKPRRLEAAWVALLVVVWGAVVVLSVWGLWEGWVPRPWSRHELVRLIQEGCKP